MPTSDFYPIKNVFSVCWTTMDSVECKDEIKQLRRKTICQVGSTVLYKWTGTHLPIPPTSSPQCHTVSGKAVIKNTSTLIMKTKHKCEKTNKQTKIVVA